MASPAPLWSPRDIPWERFDPDRVDAGTVRLVAAASLVERNAASYGRYLRSVFAGDQAFSDAIARWVAEEEQHGEVLGRWVGLADPGFDLAAARRRFAASVPIPEEARDSVRGSRLGELVARCTVEIGTSTFYAALRDSVDEPALREICRRIAGDEGRHYRLFLDHAERYRGSRGILAMAGVALGRIADTGDDELARAWHLAGGDGMPYLRRRAAAAMHLASLARYRSEHIARAVQLLARAIGCAGHARIERLATWAGCLALRLRLERAAALAAS